MTTETTRFAPETPVIITDGAYRQWVGYIAKPDEADPEDGDEVRVPVRLFASNGDVTYRFFDSDQLLTS